MASKAIVGVESHEAMLRRSLEVARRVGRGERVPEADYLGRNYSNVHRDVQRLLEHELVGKDELGRIYVPWEEVLISVRLGVAA